MLIVFRGLIDRNLITLFAGPMSHVTHDFMYSCTIVNEGHLLGAHFRVLKLKG